MPRKAVELPLVGGSEKNLPGQSGRVFNMYPARMGANAKAPFVLEHAPGSFRRYDLSVGDQLDVIPGNIRGMHRMGSRAFVAAGNYLIELNHYNLGTYTVLARLATDEGFVGFSDNAEILVVGDGRFYTIEPGIGTLTPVVTTNGEQLRGYISRFINSQTLYFIRNSDRYYYSDVGAAGTVDDLSFYTEEGNPDRTLNAHILGDQILILGEASTRPHHNPGDADNPFQAIDGGGPLEHGTVGMRASCKFDNTVAFVGQNAEGQGIVWRFQGAGSQPLQISTPTVEGHIQKVLFNGLADDITMFGYQDGGHSFCFVNLPAVPETINSPAQPSMTWVFDSATGEWHERGRKSPETGRFERVLGDCHIAWNGRHYLGDHLNPHVYEFSTDYYRENTIPLVKLVETHGPLNIGGKRFTVHGMELQLEVGVGRDGDATGGTDPQVVCQVSWDGGNTWSDEIIRDLGRIGAFKTVVKFGPAGSGRNFVARFFISDPVRVTLTACWADISAGA